MNIVGQTISIFIVFMIGLFGFMLANGVNIFKKPENSVLYGEWVEQGVPTYAADRFEVRKDGIYMNGSRRTGHYEFTGKELIYTVGDNTFVYSVKDSDTLKREKPYHYSSPFKRVPG